MREIWTELKKNAIDKKIERAILMAKAGVNKDFAIQHPDWIKQAQTKNFTDLRIKVKQAVEKSQEIAKARRDKLGGK